MGVTYPFSNYFSASHPVTSPGTTRSTLTVEPTIDEPVLTNVNNAVDTLAAPNSSMDGSSKAEMG